MLTGNEFYAQQVLRATSSKWLRSPSARAEGPLGLSVQVAGTLQGKHRAERSPPDEHHLRRCREKHAHRERRASARVVGGWGTSPGSSVGPLPLRDNTHLILCVCACVSHPAPQPPTRTYRGGVCARRGCGEDARWLGNKPNATKWGFNSINMTWTRQLQVAL